MKSFNRNKNRFLTLAFVFLLIICVNGCRNKPADDGKKSKNGPTTTAASQPTTTQSSDCIIEPGTGMASVRFGMTMKEVKDILGDPERTLGGAYEYPSKGFAILAGKDGKVASIMCGEMGKSDSPLIKACTCRTSKNIGMGSTEKEVTAAYGPSISAPENKNGMKILAYPSLHAMFTLKDGKVVHMLFNKG